MKVKDLKTGEIMECNESYGNRLIEHGRAEICIPEKTAAPAKKAASKKAVAENGTD